MGLLSTLGLPPTSAMSAKSGGKAAEAAAAPRAAPPPKSPEMKTLVARFQEVMGRVKALEEKKAPEAAELKKATVAAGNLSTSPKGIVAANAALDTVEARIADARLKLAAADAPDAPDAPDADAGGAKQAAPNDGKRLADEARQRLKSLEARGRKAIAADPRNPNAGWLGEVVANSESRFAALEKHGTQREIDSVKQHLDWFEESIERFEAAAAEEVGGGVAKGGDAAAKDAAAPDGPLLEPGKVATRLRKHLRTLDARGKRAIAADSRNPNADWLAGVVEDFGGRIDELEESGTQRDARDMQKQLDWLKDSVLRFEADAKRNAAEAGGKKPKSEDSPALKKAKAQFRKVMTEIRRLAAAKNPQAGALKDAAVAAGNLATSPKGIEDAMRALDAVMADVGKQKAEVDQAKAEAVRKRAEAAKAKREANKAKRAGAKAEAQAAEAGATGNGQGGSTRSPPTR